MDVRKSWTSVPRRQSPCSTKLWENISPSILKINFIHSLLLSGCTQLTSSGLSNLIQLRQLSELELTNCPGSSHDLVTYLRDNLPQTLVVEWRVPMAKCPKMLSDVCGHKNFFPNSFWYLNNLMISRPDWHVEKCHSKWSDVKYFAKCFLCCS